MRTAYFIAHVPTTQLERIAQLFGAGALKTNVGVVLDLSDARKAHEMLAGAAPEREDRARGPVTVIPGALTPTVRGRDLGHAAPNSKKQNAQ